MDTSQNDSLISPGEPPRGRRNYLRILAVIAGGLSLLALAVALAVALGSSPIFETTVPPFTQKEDEVFLVCLDPGHGGEHPGALSLDETRMEKDDNLSLALLVRDILLENEISVLMTRDSDDTLSLEERCQIANEAGATIFVSLHRNSGGGKGVEVWIASDADSREKRMGKAILDEIVAAGVNNNRGLRKGTANNSASDYAVIRGTDMPACIVELGFIDSDSDNDVFDTNLHSYANAIAEAIIKLTR